MPNREIAYRVADNIEQNEKNFSMSQQGHEDGSPSCIMGHLLADAGVRDIPAQPTLDNAQLVMQRLGINEETFMMLGMPMTPDAHSLAPKGHHQHIDAKRAAAQLRRVGDGKPVNYSLPVVDGKVVEHA